LDAQRGGAVVTYARVVMGPQEFAMIEGATSVGTPPWPFSVLFGGLVDAFHLPCLLASYGLADPGVEEFLGVGEALLARTGGRPDREGGA
jgi:hypothetical protein